jgi:hypothetical protein
LWKMRKNFTVQVKTNRQFSRVLVVYKIPE